MQKSGTAIFSPQDVRTIREQWDSRTINVRAWADHFGCSPETIRKVGRRDTYRDVGGPVGKSPAQLAGEAAGKGAEASARKLLDLMKQAEEEAQVGDQLIDELRDQND